MKGSFLPEWMRQYEKGYIKDDVTAGIIVAVMLVPQGMAYAMLAGMPPVTGLYASIVPILIYALIGSSRQLAVGPVAVVSLLVYAGVSPLAEPGSSEYITLAVVLMMMVGLLQLLMGVLKLGFVVKFFSHAVISAFTSAAAIIIAFSQLKHVLGVPLEEEQFLPMVVEAASRLTEVNGWAFLIAAASILLLLVSKKWIPWIPGPLLVVAAGTLFVYFSGLGQQVSIIEDVPSGLPGFAFPAVTVDHLIQLAPTALTITFIGFMESFAMAKVIAAKENYRIHANRELAGLGAANAGGAFFGGFPVTGGFSRSAVNYESGAKTPLSSIVTAFSIMLTLLFLTSLFYYLPNAVLAAIIIVAVYKLVDIKEAKTLFKLRRIDGIVWTATFAGTLILGVETGIIAGIIFSLVVFIWQSAYPHTAELGYVESDEVLRNIERFPDAVVKKDTLMLRIDAPLYFANAAFAEEKLETLIYERAELKRIVLDFSGVNSVDAVAVEEVTRWKKEWEEKGLELVIVEMRGPVRDVFMRAGWREKDLHIPLRYAEEQYFDSTRKAR
ncbi:SulP family inorganic anion transporter [Alkalicoccus urumqiensis]|uniref:Sodium-independent anion transporter n=1 Tax=Alkalicoccus urumqiensis TaxID=1548213 RepID=A0A2P6MEW2_ALKUR|nr:sulfate permease [Alkalicoccus urumqiensis]PRO64826.1 sodium-independent anion transporter [Alkalicoccus urumqiensis]